ncbi:hypothetical protein KPL76_11960 [Subtercola sp. PAMC28395]|uniref:hypothetical protein n=1 Tax=Subtercola sp. PAMC28395 TaxID=2846775 RepID=UPI001C0CECBA|nr:hypothetical protein [Subtercola sp. PAMC28395]QWT23426.1 hypothetical protein KPL76_11960 [Subtercola sp. PAMC28395]
MVPAVTVASETAEFDWYAQSASALADIDRAVDRILEADRASHRPRARVADLAARSKAAGARQLTRAASAVRSRVKLVIVSVSVVTVALVGSLSAGATASHTQASGYAASDALVSSTPSSAAPGEATAVTLPESSGRASRLTPDVLTADDPRAAALSSAGKSGSLSFW